VVVAATKKFDQETRERAVRMYQDRLAGSEDSKLAARRHVGELLGINQATLRNWIEDRHGGGRPVVTDPPGDRDAEVATLRKENAELRRANEILKTASAFFAATDWPAYSTSNSTP
jgi:transposase